MKKSKPTMNGAFASRIANFVQNFFMTSLWKARGVRWNIPILDVIGVPLLGFIICLSPPKHPAPRCNHYTAFMPRKYRWSMLSVKIFSSGNIGFLDQWGAQVGPVEAPSCVTRFVFQKNHLIGIGLIRMQKNWTNTASSSTNEQEPLEVKKKIIAVKEA